MEIFHEDFAELITECEKYKSYLQELGTKKEAIMHPPKVGKINRETWQARHKDTHLPSTDFRKAQESYLVRVQDRFELMQDILKLAGSTENEEFLLTAVQEALRSVQNKLNTSLNSLVPLFTAASPEEVVDLDSKVNAIGTEKGLISTIIALTDKIYARLEMEELAKHQNEGLHNNKQDQVPAPRARCNDAYFALIAECEAYINYLNNSETTKDEDPTHQNVGKVNRAIWRQRQEDTYLSSSDFLKAQESDLIKPASRLEIMQDILKFAKSTPNSEIAVSTLQSSLRAFQASLQSYQDSLWPEFKKIDPQEIEDLISKIQTTGEEESFISKLLKMSNKCNQLLEQNNQQLNASKVEESNQRVREEEEIEQNDQLLKEEFDSETDLREKYNAKYAALIRKCEDYLNYLQKSKSEIAANLSHQKVGNPREAWQEKSNDSNSSLIHTPKAQERVFFEAQARIEIMHDFLTIAKSAPNNEIGVRALQNSLQDIQNNLTSQIKNIPEGTGGLVSKKQALKEQKMVSDILLQSHKVIRSHKTERNELNKLSQLAKICEDYEQYLKHKLDQKPTHRISLEKKQQVVSNIILVIGGKDKVTDEKYSAIKKILKVNESLLTKRQSSPSHQFFKLMMNILTLGLMSKLKRDSFQFWKTRGQIYKDKLKTIINKELRIK